MPQRKVNTNSNQITSNTKIKKTVIKTIKLTAPKGETIISGRQPALLLREKHNLDELDKKDGIVKVRVFAEFITSSFILGLFHDSARQLGEKEFFQKYIFVKAPDDVMQNIRINVKYSAAGTALS